MTFWYFVFIFILDSTHDLNFYLLQHFVHCWCNGCQWQRSQVIAWILWKLWQHNDLGHIADELAKWQHLRGVWNLKIVTQWELTIVKFQKQRLDNRSMLHVLSVHRLLRLNMFKLCVAIMYNDNNLAVQNKIDYLSFYWRKTSLNVMFLRHTQWRIQDLP